MNTTQTRHALLQENQRLRERLEEMEEALRAIRSGDVDALVMSGPDGEQVYTVTGALEPYRAMVEAMSEGAVTLTQDGVILHCNARFAKLVKMPQEQIVGQSARRWVVAGDQNKFDDMVAASRRSPANGPLTLQVGDGSLKLANVSMTPLPASVGAGIAVVMTDLTDVVAAAEARTRQLESEDRFKYMFDHSAVGKSITSPSGEMQVNPAFCEMLGYSAEELSRFRWQDVTPPEDIELTEKAIASLVAGEREAVRFVKRYRHKNGSVVWGDLSTALRRDAAGNPLYYMTSVIDITERTRLQEEVKLNERHFRALIEHSVDAIAVIDADNHILYHSPSVAAVEGYTPEELAGSNGITNTHPDDVALVQSIVRQTLDHPGRAIPCTWRRRHKDGRWLWLEGVAINLLNDPAVSGIVTNYRDVTERKLAEEALALAHERLRRFIDSNIVGVVIATAGGGVVEANDYYLQLIGYTREELERGTVDWRTITPPEWLPADEQALRELRERGTCTPYEKECARRDGTRVQIILADTLLPGPEEQIAAFVLDNTRRKGAENEIRQLNAELEQRVKDRTASLEAANKEMEAFSYSVSHDLRAPLRAIDGFSRKVVANYGDKIDDEGRRQLQVVRDSAQRMSQLIDDLLSFSRLGRREMAWRPLDMEALARGVADELRMAEPGRSIEFSFAPLPQAVGDAAMLRQVWVNLLGNAVKFTRQRAVAHIDVGGRAGGGEVIYWVKDDGAGFDMRYADKLFGVFQRLHRQDEFEGTGVGLALAQRIMHRHNGRIAGEGKPDAGAIFTFALPLTNDHPPGEQAS